MAATTKAMTVQEFKEWLDGAFAGDPSTASSWCQQTMSPNYLRFQAGGGRTDFAQAVEKVTTFRTIGKKWESTVKFFLQDGNKIAARVICDYLIGEGPEKKVEVMFMGELDEQGRFENVWEQTSDFTEAA